MSPAAYTIEICSVFRLYHPYSYQLFTLNITLAKYLTRVLTLSILCTFNHVHSILTILSRLFETFGSSSTDPTPQVPRNVRTTHTFHMKVFPWYTAYCVLGGVRLVHSSQSPDYQGTPSRLVSLFPPMALLAGVPSIASRGLQRKRVARSRLTGELGTPPLSFPGRRLSTRISRYTTAPSLLTLVCPGRVDSHALVRG